MKEVRETMYKELKETKNSVSPNEDQQPSF